MSSKIDVIAMPGYKKSANMYTLGISKYRDNKHSITTMKQISKILSGIVYTDDTPTEGKGFTFYYYMVDGIQTFGIITIPVCINVYAEEDTIYFESTKDKKAYILKKHIGN